MIWAAVIGADCSGCTDRWSTFENGTSQTRFEIPTEKDQSQEHGACRLRAWPWT